MFLQGRVIIVWLSWFIGGVCGVVILLIIICYCRLMPRHQKSLDEQYLKENYTIKENQTYSYQDNYRVKHAEVSPRPASYAGAPPRRAAPPPAPRPAPAITPAPAPATPALYASSGMLDEAEAEADADALKTRSLPAALRTRTAPPAPTPADRHNKMSLSKKYKNRMRSEHAAIIALSKSRGQLQLEREAEADAEADADADACERAVVVYDQRTRL